MPEKLADGDYGALLRCDWRRSPDGTESEWLPFTLDNSMLTPCSGGPNVTVSLAVHTLTLVNGSRVVTNGNGLRLQAARIVVSKASVISKIWFLQLLQPERLE